MVDSCRMGDFIFPLKPSFKLMF